VGELGAAEWGLLGAQALREVPQRRGFHRL
jgi:hypothetical protein